jgi:hypothetical protein
MSKNTNTNYEINDICNQLFYCNMEKLIETNRNSKLDFQKSIIIRI